MSEMKDVRLLPCPHCYGEAELCDNVGQFEGAWLVSCSECAASTGIATDPNVVVSAWNRRADPEPAPKPAGGEWVTVPREPTKEMVWAFWNASGPDAERYRAMLAAAPPAPAASLSGGEVTVKALGWRRGYCDDQVIIEQASFGGLYQVRQFDGDIWLDHPSASSSKHETVGAAKAAAQADFEQRILSNLTSPEAPQANEVVRELAEDAVRGVLPSALVGTNEQLIQNIERVSMPPSPRSEARTMTSEITEEMVEAACKAYAPQWNRMDSGIKTYARAQMRDAISAALAARPAPEARSVVERLRADDLLYNRGPDYEPLRVKPSALRLDAADLVQSQAAQIASLSAKVAEVEKERDAYENSALIRKAALDQVQSVASELQREVERKDKALRIIAHCYDVEMASCHARAALQQEGESDV